MLKKFWGWLKKLLTDSFTGALTQFLSGVIFTLLVVTLVTFVSILSKTIPIPGYILAILILIALIGVLIQISKTINILHDYRTRNMQLKPIKKSKEKIKFEEYPREWRAQVWKADEGWCVENIEVYCTLHDLRLQPVTSQDDPRDARSGRQITSVCSDCEQEGIRYKENSSAGCAFHSYRDWQYFEEEIKSRFIRKVETEKKHRE